MKRCVATFALFFGSGLMTMAGMLACVYRMPACEGTPSCHQHQQPVKSKSDCCRNGFATGQAAALTQRGKSALGVMDNATGSTALELVAVRVSLPDAVSRPDGSFPPILNLRV